MANNQINQEDFEQLKELEHKLEELIYEAENAIKSLPRHLRERAKAYWLGNLKEAVGEGLSPCSLRKFFDEAEAFVVDEDEDEDEEDAA